MTWFRCSSGGGGGEIQPFPYTESKTQKGATPIEFSLPSTNNKKTHITITGTVYAPSALVGFEATVGTILNNNLIVTATSEYHWDYIQTFDITCEEADGRIIYNGALNGGSVVTATVFYYVVTPSTKYESYIYALGNIGFNTGYTHTANTKIRFKASIGTFVGGYTQVFGARNGSFRANAFTFFGRGNFDGYTICRTGSEVRGNTIAEDSSGSPWNQTPCIFTAEGTEISWYRDFDPNTVRRIQGSGTADGGIAPLAIFCCNSTTTAGGWSDGDYIVDMRLFWFEIYESDVLVHRFVPAYNNSQWCLYDEVDQTYIYDVVSNGANVRGWLAS